MARDDLTETQVKVLKYMRSYYRRNGFYATVRDVQKHMGWRSVSTAHGVLLALTAKRRVQRKQVTRSTIVFMPVEM